MESAVWLKFFSEKGIFNQGRTFPLAKQCKKAAARVLLRLGGLHVLSRYIAATPAAAQTAGFRLRAGKTAINVANPL